MLQPITKPIDEPISKHEANIANSTSEWENADDLAVALLEHNTEGPARDIVLDAPSAWEAWENLRGQYEGKNRVNLYALYNDINTLKFDDRATMIDEHIVEFNNRWSRLAATVGGDANIKTAAGIHIRVQKDILIFPYIEKTFHLIFPLEKIALTAEFFRDRTGL
jgi:hypothetical protein